MARQATSHIGSTAPEQAKYASTLFSKFCSDIKAMEGTAPLLDLGPSTTRNVMYWLRGNHPVSAFDIMVHEMTDQISLDYEDCAFGGVLAWTVLSHLGPGQARQLMREIGRVLRPRGCLFAVFDGDGRRIPGAQRYQIIDAKNLEFEPIEGRGTARAVLTREVETLFQPFRETRIVVMRHGSREVLGKQP